MRVRSTLLISLLGVAASVVVFRLCVMLLSSAPGQGTGASLGLGGIRRHGEEGARTARQDRRDPTTTREGGDGGGGGGEGGGGGGSGAPAHLGGDSSREEGGAPARDGGVGEAAHAALADGCRYVYLDLGANMGVQVRKLFEADRVGGCNNPLDACMAGAGICCFKRLFTEHFGAVRQRQRPGWGVCAFMFEPNVVHKERLRALEASYQRQGWRVTVFTETAIGPSDGVVSLARDQDEQPGDRYFKEGEHPRALSASTTVNWGRGSREVTQVDIARWVLENVAHRAIPEVPAAAMQADEPPPPPPFVIMKMDTEGAEHLALPRMALSRALCHVDVASVEYHYWGNRGGTGLVPKSNLHANVTALLHTDAACTTRLLASDDETGMDKASRELPFP